MVRKVFHGVVTEAFLFPLTRVVESPVPMLRDLTQNSAVRSVNSGLLWEGVQRAALKALEITWDLCHFYPQRGTAWFSRREMLSVPCQDTVEGCPERGCSDCEG